MTNQYIIENQNEIQRRLVPIIKKIRSKGKTLHRENKVIQKTLKQNAEKQKEQVHINTKRTKYT